MDHRPREIYLIKDIATGKLSVPPGRAHLGVDVQVHHHHADGTVTVELLCSRPQLILDQDALGGVTIRHQDIHLVVKHLTQGGPV